MEFSNFDLYGKQNEEDEEKEEKQQNLSEIYKEKLLKERTVLVYGEIT